MCPGGPCPEEQLTTDCLFINDFEACDADGLFIDAIEISESATSYVDGPRVPVRRKRASTAEAQNILDELNSLSEDLVLGVDSGSHVSVIPPQTARGYPVKKDKFVGRAYHTATDQSVKDEGKKSVVGFPMDSGVLIEGMRRS